MKLNIDTVKYKHALQQIQFSKDNFTFYVLLAFIITHYPDMDVLEILKTKEISKFENALEDVLKLVKDIDRFDNNISNI